MSKAAREQFGADIREARIRAGMSQTEVGKLTDIGQAYVSELEMGKRNITIDTMMSLARAVGLDVVIITRPAPQKR